MTCVGAQCGAELEVLLEVARLVGARQLWMHAAGDDLGAEATGCARHEPSVEDEHHLVGPTDVEVITDDTLEEGAASLRTVEHACVGDLELTEGEVVGVAGLQIFGGKR
jgi:hypothetical protein